MGYVRRFTTTGRVELPQDVKREAELLYIHDVLNLIETHEIPKVDGLKFESNASEVCSVL